MTIVPDAIKAPSHQINGTAVPETSVKDAETLPKKTPFTTEPVVTDKKEQTESPDQIFQEKAKHQSNDPKLSYSKTIPASAESILVIID